MSDAADLAAAREAEHIADRLDAQSRRAALDRPGNALCADCHEEIPRARRRALPSAIRCVSCQELLERVKSFSSPSPASP
jgi:DnaK suppressor protein